MKNTLSDLNNYLFEALERVNDAESQEELEGEIKRANATISIGKTIIENANAQLEVVKHMDEYGYNLQQKRVMPAFLEVKE